MVSGSFVYNKLNSLQVELAKSQAKSSGELNTSEFEIDSLSREREEGYVKLALHYLPEMTAEAVRKTISEAQEEVQKIFRARQERRAKLEQSMEAAGKRRLVLEERLQIIDDTLTKKAAERDNLIGEIEKGLKERPDYTEVIGTATGLSETLEGYERAFNEFRENAERKLGEYRESKLFAYLLNCNFGTPEYSAGRIRETLDSWVAEMIGFSKAIADYKHLVSIPELMQAEIQRTQSSLKPLQEKVDAIEKEFADRYGLTRVLEEGRKYKKDKDEVISSIEETDKESRAYANERREIDGEKDEFYRQAIGKLKEYLKGETISELKTLARSTPGSEDDGLVARIGEIDSSIRTLKDSSKEIRGRRDVYQENAQEVKDILLDFKRRDFDEEGSNINVDLDDLIKRYVSGKISNTILWSELEAKRTYHKPKPAYTDDEYGGGYGKIYGGGHSHSGGSRSSNWGGSGGGGFKLGGGSGGGSFHMRGGV